MIPVDACFNWKANNFLLEKVSWGTTRVIIYMDSKLLVPAVCFAELTGFNWIMGHLVRATCTKTWLIYRKESNVPKLYKDWCRKKETKRSNKTLLWLVSFFLHRSLVAKILLSTVYTVHYNILQWHFAKF